MVCDYGEILSPASLSVAPLGGINLHGSLAAGLSRRRARPLGHPRRAIRHRSQRDLDDSPLGCGPRIDPAPARHATRTRPRRSSSNAWQPWASPPWKTRSNCWRLGTAPVPSGTTARPPARSHPHGDSVGTTASSTGSRSAVEIANQVRGLQPWPGAFTTWHRDAKVCPQLQVLKARVMRDTGVPPRPGVPGEIAVGPHGEFQVATGNGWLELIQVRPQNRSIMAGADFLRGYRLATSERLGHRSTPPE